MGPSLLAAAISFGLASSASAIAVPVPPPDAVSAEPPTISTPPTSGLEPKQNSPDNKARENAVPQFNSPEAMAGLFDGARPKPKFEISNEVLAVNLPAPPILNKRLGVTIKPAFRAGVLHPGAGSGDVLQASPYAAANYKVTGSRWLDWHATVSRGFLGRNSVPTPGGSARWRSDVASDAPPDERLSRTSPVSFQSIDAGKSMRLANGVGASVFVEQNHFEALDDVGWQRNIGAVLALKTLGGIVSASAVKSFVYESKTPGQNRYGWKQDILSGNLSIDVRTSARSAWKAAVAAVISPAETSIEPSLMIASDSRAATLSAYASRPKMPFLPSETGLTANLAERLTENVALKASASYIARRYETSREVSRLGNASIGFSITRGRNRAEAAAKPLRPIGEKDLDPAAGEERRRALTEDNLQAYGAVHIAMSQGKNFDQFAKILAGRVQSYDMLLQTLAVIGQRFNDFNYDFNYGDPENAVGANDIYTQVRASWLDGQKRKTGVCITQSQFNEYIVEAVSKINGLGIKAITASFMVPTEKGKEVSKHSLLAIVGPDGQITIQDWGALRPMGTTDVLEAFRRYQSFQGIPAARWRIDPGNGYATDIFTSEGRLVLERTTGMGDPGRHGEGRANGSTNEFKALAIENALSPKNSKKP